MANFKKYLIGLIIIVVALMVISVFIPQEYEVKVKQKMDGPHSMVNNAVNDFYTWPLWYGALSEDTLIYEANIKDFKSFNHELQYNNGIIRKVAQSINDSILVYDEGQNKKPINLNYKFLNIDSDNSEIEVTATTSSGYFTNLLNFVYKFRLQKAISSDIKRLNAMVNERFDSQLYHGFNIQTISMPEKYYVTRRATVPADGLTDFYKVNLAALYQSALNDNLAISGSPVLLKYSDITQNNMDVAVGLPTLSEVALINSTQQVFPSQIAYQIEHKGYSTDTQKAHVSLMAFFKDKELEYQAPICEEFPGQSGASESETTNVVRIIYYPKQ